MDYAFNGVEPEDAMLRFAKSKQKLPKAFFAL